jgi:hypothetical protein
MGLNYGNLLAETNKPALCWKSSSLGPRHARAEMMRLLYRKQLPGYLWAETTDTSELNRANWRSAGKKKQLA